MAYYEDDGELLGPTRVSRSVSSYLSRLEAQAVAAWVERPEGQRVWSARCCHRKKDAAESARQRETVVTRRYVAREFKQPVLGDAFSSCPSLGATRIVM